TGFAFPAILVKIVTLFRAGCIDEAADVFYQSVPLMRFEFQEGIGMAIRKEVLRRRGAIAHAGIRAPGGTLDETTKKALDRVMEGTQQPSGAPAATPSRGLRIRGEVSAKERGGGGAPPPVEKRRRVNGPRTEGQDRDGWRREQRPRLRRCARAGG